LVDEVLREVEARVARTRRRRLVMAGAAAIVCAALTLVFRSSPPPRPTSSAPVAEIVALAGRTLLPDGSVAELKAGAEISVGFSAQRAGPRRIRLIRGEAHFEVAKDQEHPFIVATGVVDVRAVGTAFSVDLESHQVEVLVSEGRVAVDDSPLPSTAPALNGPTPGITANPLTLDIVDAGNRLVVPIENGAVWPDHLGKFAVPAAEMARRLAWLSQKLEFSATPLAQALAMFNERNEDQLVLTDPSLGQLQISGYLSVHKTDTFVLMLQTDFGLKVERHGPHQIIIGRP
jgi:transmembrane sensor